MQDECKYIIWTDYGYDGWQCEGFKTLEELQEYLKMPQNFGNEFVVTKVLDYKVEVKDED